MKIITGNPGTGKHTVAKAVARRLNLNLMDINRIAISEKVVKKGPGTLDVDVNKLKKIIDKGPRDALLVGHLAPYAVSGSRVELAVVLRRSPYSLEREYRKRGYAKKKALENLGSEILGITYHDTVKSFGRKKTFQFDTTGKSVSETAKRIESLFSNGKARDDDVDWLMTISKKGDLKRFFPY